jgi:hypothetical protein
LDRWRDQYDRAERWLSRIEQIAAGIGPEMTAGRNTDHFLDEVLAFFQSCFHLKDWLRNDPQSGVGVKEVERYVASDQSLSLCGDVANGSKHLLLTTPRVGGGARVSAQHVDINVTDGVMGTADRGTSFRAAYVISDGQREFDALKVARDAMQAWDAFFSNKGLVP